MILLKNLSFRILEIAVRSVCYKQTDIGKRPVALLVIKSALLTPNHLDIFDYYKCFISYIPKYSQVDLV